MVRGVDIDQQSALVTTSLTERDDYVAVRGNTCFLAFCFLKNVLVLQRNARFGNLKSTQMRCLVFGQGLGVGFYAEGF